MKRAEINNILDNSNIKDLVYSQSGGSWKLHDLLVEELGEDKCPSETAIITYIRKQLNFIWDKEKHLWIAFKEDTNHTKKGSQKRGKKSPEALTTTNEIETENNDNSALGDENLSINENSTNFNLSEKSSTELGENNNLFESKNKEKNASNSTENKTTNSAKKGKKKKGKESSETFTKTHEIEIDDDNFMFEDRMDSALNEKASNSNSAEKINNIESDTPNIKDSSSNSKSTFKYKNIDPSQYPEYIELYGNEKLSLSLSSFIIRVVEQIMLEKYNKKMGMSKIVNLALMEYIRINTNDTNKDSKR